MEKIDNDKIKENKENLILLISKKIHKMTNEEFLNFSCTIDLFNNKKIDLFKNSFDNEKIKLTFINGINSLINFLEYVKININKADIIKTHLEYINYILLVKS